MNTHLGITMKRILFFALTTFLLVTLTACDKGKNSYEDLIVGSWVASDAAVMEESGMKITISDMTASYAKDHTATGGGKMSLSGPGLPTKLEMSMSTKTTWRIEGNLLKETITDIDLKILTKVPGMPDLSPMIEEQMKAKGEGSVTIITLDKNTFEYKEEEAGMQVTMKRK